MLKIKVQHFQCVPLTSSISIDFHYIRSGKKSDILMDTLLLNLTSVLYMTEC